jgi:nucleotide-binding universal stress UspA family protein
MGSRKIAVGIDFSPESEIAAHQALDLARHIDGELVLVHAGAMVEIPVVPRSSPPATAQVVEVYRSQLELTLERDRQRLAELRQRLSGGGATVSHVLVEGFPDEGVTAAARDMGAELLVLGTHGRTGLKWFFLGSVAQRVVRMSETDVLVARGNDGVARGGYHRILVATDFSPSSVRAYEGVQRLAAAGAKIDVVHFFHGAPRVELYDSIRNALGSQDLARTIAAELTERGQRFIAERSRNDLAVQFHVVPDAPLPGILHWLEQQRFGLVALGSHGRRGFHRFAVGSVAEAVARRAPCSVLVARGPTAPDA